MPVFALFCLQWIIVFIIDVSGVVGALKRLICRFLTQGNISSENFQLKPLDCSLCSTWWCGLIYLLFTGQFTLPMIALVALLAALTPVTANLFWFLTDLLLNLTNKRPLS